MKHLILLTLILSTLISTGQRRTKREIRNMHKMLATKEFKPEISNYQEINLANGYRHVVSERRNTIVSAAPYYINGELHFFIGIVNKGNKKVSIDWDDIRFYTTTNEIPFYTDREFLNFKAGQIQHNQAQKQYLSAYLNNEFNKGERNYIPDDYFKERPTDKLEFDRAIDSYSDALFRPQTLNPGEYTMGRIYMKWADLYMVLDVYDGEQDHIFKWYLQ
jgi:hypothetical protein